jgi:hypothetical protein
MKITSTEGGMKFNVEVEGKDIVSMQGRTEDYVRQEITKGVIEVIKNQILADEVFVNRIKNSIAKSLEKVKIENIEIG